MQINFNSIPFLGSVNKVSNNRPQGAKINQGPASDVFVKSTEQAAPISRFEDEKYITELYNQTYNEVMAQNIKNNPIVGELNIEQPKLIIGNKKNAAEDASYMFPSNTITVQKKAMNEDVAVIHYEDEGEKYVLRMLYKDKADECIKELEKEYPGVKFSYEVLNDDEKEFLIKASIAHELRHFIQMHLLASTEGCEDIFEKYKEKSHHIQNLISEIEAGGGHVDEKTKHTCDSSYIDNYKPKKILPSDTKYKFSLIEDDTKQMSVKDGIRKSCKLQGEAANSDDDNAYGNIYMSLPHEIDAYNYEAEYAYTQIKNAKNGAREKILEDIALYSSLTAMKGMEDAETMGTKFFAD